MSMRLTAKDFAEISTALEKLNDLEVTVREVEVVGHKLLLRQEDGEYYVLGMTTGEFSGRDR